MDTKKADTQDNEITATVDFGDEAPPPVPASRPVTEYKKPAAPLAVGDWVRRKGEPAIASDFASFGVVVYRNGKHDKTRPRVRWGSGVGQTEHAMDLEILSAEARAGLPEVAQFDCDRADESEAVEAEKDAPEGKDTPPRADWPEEGTVNREAWLTCAALRIAKDPAALNGVLFSVGFGKGGTRGEKPFAIVDNEQGTGRQVYVRPTISERTQAARAVNAALRQMGIKCQPYNSSTFPAYPQPETSTEQTKTQATRLIKCVCNACAFTFRSTAKWIDKAEDAGVMRCPMPKCSGRVCKVA